MHKAWFFIGALGFVGLGCILGIIIEQNNSVKLIQNTGDVDKTTLVINEIKSIAIYPEQTWLNIKSPISNKCYEVLLFNDWAGGGYGYGYMGMSEITCEILDLEVSQKK